MLSALAERRDLNRESPLADRLAPDATPGGYRVRAIWQTLQGEGAFAGYPAVFVRFAGCNLWSGDEAHRRRDHARLGAACALFCDTDFRKAGSVRIGPDALAAHVRQVADAGRLDDSPGPRLAVLTGGEPLLQADALLVTTLRAEGFAVAVETNGTVALADAFGPDPAHWPDWVACSPKLPESHLNIEAMDELKLVVPAYTPDAYPTLAARVRPQRLGGREVFYRWLQPEDGPRLAEARRVAVALAKAHPSWRVSVQTHKVLGVD